MSKVLDLSHLDPFSFSISEEKKDTAGYGLLLDSEIGSHELVDSFVFDTVGMIDDFQELGKTVFEERF